MTINDEIIILANQLANAGNKPTVALIKTKLNKRAPLPTIISTLKTWQHDPSLISSPEEKHHITEKSNATTEIDPFIQELSKELTQMKQEIIELKQQDLQKRREELLLQQA